MVTEAMLLPDDVVENVARRQGEVSLEAVRKEYSEGSIQQLQREARDGDGDVTVLAVLDETERERVEEAAAAAGEHPAVWLASSTLDVIDERGAVAGPVELGEQVERAIFDRAPV